MEKQNQDYYVVNCSECDREHHLGDEPVRLEMLGLFTQHEKARLTVNSDLMKRFIRISRHYETVLGQLKEELAETLKELAQEKDPDMRESLKYCIDALEEDKRYYEKVKIPQVDLEYDERGLVAKVTCSDENLCWKICYEIIRTNPQ